MMPENTFTAQLPAKKLKTSLFNSQLHLPDFADWGRKAEGQMQFESRQMVEVILAVSLGYLIMSTQDISCYRPIIRLLLKMEFTVLLLAVSGCFHHYSEF